MVQDPEKNVIAKYYSDKYNKQYKPIASLRISSEDMEAALKIIVVPLSRPLIKQI